MHLKIISKIFFLLIHFFMNCVASAQKCRLKTFLFIYFWIFVIQHFIVTKYVVNNSFNTLKATFYFVFCLTAFMYVVCYLLFFYIHVYLNKCKKHFFVRRKMCIKAFMQLLVYYPWRSRDANNSKLKGKFYRGKVMIFFCTIYYTKFT